MFEVRCGGHGASTTACLAPMFNSFGSCLFLCYLLCMLGPLEFSLVETSEVILPVCKVECDLFDPRRICFPSLWKWSHVLLWLNCGINCSTCTIYPGGCQILGSSGKLLDSTAETTETRLILPYQADNATTSVVILNIIIEVPACISQFQRKTCVSRNSACWPPPVR